MFDMAYVGGKIAELRKSNNMTQLELADRLGISFQAVSNWERGNSMPDIAKLPEISELFGVSVDEILGKRNTVLDELSEHGVVNLENHAGAAITEAAILLKPQQIRQMLASGSQGMPVVSLLLPFLNSESIEELVHEYKQAGENIAIFLPFLRQDKVSELAREASEKGEPVGMYLPFMSKESVSELAFAAFESAGAEGAVMFLPFLCEEDLQKLSEKMLEQA